MLFIWNRGMPMSSISSMHERTPVLKRNVLVISFQLSGSLIYSCVVSKRTINGHCSVPINANTYRMFGAKNSTNFTPGKNGSSRQNFIIRYLSLFPDTNRKVSADERSKLKTFGLPSSMHKLKRVHHSWSTRIIATPRAINSIWAPFTVRIYVRKSSSTHHPTK